MTKEDEEKVVLQFEKEGVVQFSRSEIEKITYDSPEERGFLRAEWEKKLARSSTTSPRLPSLQDTGPPLSPTRESQLLFSQGTWHPRKTQHFLIYYQDPVQGKAVSSRAEYHLEKIVDDLRLRRTQDWRKKYTVFVVQEESHWRHFLEELKIEPELTGGFTTGLKTREIFLYNLSIPYLQLAFPHELTHLILDELAKGKKFPLWFDEGFANYEGGIIGIDEALLTEAVKNGKQISLSELVQNTTYPNDLERKKLFYTESEKLVEYLMTQYGRRRFGEFTETLLRTSDFEQAFLSAYGGKISNLTQLEQLWLRYISE